MTSFFSTVLLNVVLLFGVQALSSSSSSSLGEVSVQNSTDTCGQQEYVNDCWYPVSCQTCLMREGCAVQVATGDCVSITASEFESDAITAGFYLSGEVDYCSSADPACISCRKSDASDVCLGLDLCVCMAKCEQISSQPTRCAAGVAEISSTSLVLVGVILVPLVLYMLAKGCCDVSLSRMLWQRRRAKNARKLPGSLMLESWWNHINQQADPAAAEGFADLELRSCFVSMQSAREGEHTQQRARQDVEADTSDVASAVAATDLPTESPTERREAATQLV